MFDDFQMLLYTNNIYVYIYIYMCVPQSNTLIAKYYFFILRMFLFISLILSSFLLENKKHTFQTQISIYKYI